METKLLQVTIYVDQEVYVRDSPEFKELLEILTKKLVNNKTSTIKLLFKYYNLKLKQIEYQYTELQRLKTRL